MEIRKYMLALLLMSVVTISNTCENMVKDDSFSLNKSVYSGNELRLDGYYYYMVGADLYDTYFFYRDCIIFSGGGNAPGSLPFEFVENNFATSSILNSIQKDKLSWGVFKIIGNTIEFERWYPSSGGPLPSYIRSGEILNDTTFRITKSMRSNGSEVRARDEIYHFKAFSPKPDSTNKFIK